MRGGKLIHGHKRRGAVSSEYRTWLGMKRRCQCPRSKDFPKYGGRGIAVCERWDASFEAFLEDMGPRPSPTHSIDRIDSSGHYEPGNCRWATALQQCAENRRNIFPVTVNGATFTSIKAACRAFGTSYSACHMRIAAGHDLVEAITTSGRMPNRRPRESYLPRNKRA